MLCKVYGKCWWIHPNPNIGDVKVIACLFSYVSNTKRLLNGVLNVVTLFANVSHHKRTCEKCEIEEKVVENLKTVMEGEFKRKHL